MGNIRGYSLPIAVRQTATSAANAVVWTMLNPTTSKKVVYLRRLFLTVMFDGTAAGSQSQYRLRRFRTAVPAGGTAQTPVPHALADKGASGVAQVSPVVSQFLDTGLTVAGIVVDPAIAFFGAPRQVAPTQYQMDFDSHESGSGFGGRGAIGLDIGDGLLLDLAVVAVVGDGIQGYASWDEMGGAG